MPFYEKMSRQIEADGTWILQDTRIRNWLIQPDVQGFKAHPIMNTNWQYFRYCFTKSKISDVFMMKQNFKLSMQRTSLVLLLGTTLSLG